MTLPHDDLADSWRSARPAAAVLHLDHAACSRVSTAVLDAELAHLRAEAEIGGYAAQAAAEPALAAGRLALGRLLGLGADDVTFTESGQLATAQLLGCWPGLRPGATVALPRTEYGPTVAWLADRGIAVVDLPDDGGILDVPALPAFLEATAPTLAVIGQLPSQRGVVQPAREATAACHAAGVPVLLDAAQSLGHLRVDDVGADAVIATSRKWLAGPRGVGILAVAPAFAGTLELRAPALDRRWDPSPQTVVERLGSHEAHVAGRVGLAVAAVEHLAAGPERVRARLAALGAATAEALDGVAGWRVAPGQGGSAIVSLLPPAGLDVARVRADLLAGHGVLTTCAGDRAPRDDLPPLLRVSPHVDATAGDLQAAAEALAAVS